MRSSSSRVWPGLCRKVGLPLLLPWLLHKLAMAMYLLHTVPGLRFPHIAGHEFSASRSIIAAAEEGSALEASARLLAMFVNRGNSSWAADRAPTLWEKAEQDKWAGEVQGGLCTSHLQQGTKSYRGSLGGPLTSTLGLRAHAPALCSASQ